MCLFSMGGNALDCSVGFVVMCQQKCVAELQISEKSHSPCLTVSMVPAYT